MVGPLETLQRRHAAPSAPIRPWTSTNTTHQPICGARAQLGGSGLPLAPVVARSAEQDRERQQDPHWESDREHEDSNAKNERVHFLVVVAWWACAVPRSRDPLEDGTSVDATGREAAASGALARTEFARADSVLEHN